MSHDAEALLEMAGLLYEGVIAPEAWDEFLRRLCRKVGCDFAAVSIHETQIRPAEVVATIGMPQEIVDEWRILSSGNPRAPQVLRALGRSNSWIGANSLSRVPASYRETEYFEWLRRTDLYHSLLTAVRLDSQAGSLSLARPRTGKPFSKATVDFLRLLVPHLQRALRIRARNQTLMAMCEAGKSALDRLDTGVAVLDANGRVIMMNRQAEAVLEKGGGEHLDRPVDEAMRNGRSRRFDDVQVIVTPCDSSRGGDGLALAFFSDPAGKPASREPTLRSQFGLTPAECRLAGLLHQGKELRTAAETMKVTSTTARFMLKRIFHKTGSHRQSQLIRLMSSLPGGTGY